MKVLLRSSWSLAWSRRVVILALAWAAGCSPEKAEDPAALQDIVFDPSGIGRVDLTMEPADLAALDADPEAERYLPGNFAYASPDRKTGKALQKIGIRYKGNTSLDKRLPKLPIKVRFNQYIKGQRFAGLKKLGFGTEYGDPTFVREALAYRMARAAGTLAPRTQYVRIFLNGQDRGLYLLTEEEDDVFLKAHFADGSGNLYKASRGPLLYWGDDPEDYQGRLGQYAYEEGLEHKPQYGDLIALAKLLSLATDAELGEKLPQLLDVDGWLDVLAVATLQVNLDAPTYSANNFFLYRQPSNGRFSVMGWDMDSSFAAFPPTASPQQKVALDIYNPKLTADPRPLVDRILGHPNWQQAWIARLGKMRKTVFQPQELEAQVRKTALLIRPELQSDPRLIYGYAAAVTGLDSDVAAEDPVRRYPQPFPGLVPFLYARAAAVDAQLASAVASWPKPPKLTTVQAKWTMGSGAPKIKGKAYVYLQGRLDGALQTYLVRAHKELTQSTSHATVSLPEALTSAVVTLFVDTGDDGWVDPQVDYFGSVDAAIVGGWIQANVTVTGPWLGEPIWATKFGAPTGL